MPAKFDAVIRKMIDDLSHCLENFHLPLIKAFKDQGLLLRFLRNKKINRKLGNFFYKKAFEAFKNLSDSKRKNESFQTFEGKNEILENIEERELFSDVFNEDKGLFEALDERKMKNKGDFERKKRDFKEIYEKLKEKELELRDREKLLVIWESLIRAKEFYLKEEVYEKAYECLKGVRMVYELMEDLCN